jgi:hypothetical protein
MAIRKKRWRKSSVG